MKAELFQAKLLEWFALQGRKNLPWRQHITPYRIWVSEIMLQQTQVKTVIPYFNRFIDNFPDVEALALASLDSVLHCWSGLGYYARARNLHQSAQIIHRQGRFPGTVDEWNCLPGIGLSTAGAIMSIAYGRSHPILDGNVKRVLTRFGGIEGWPGQTVVGNELWSLSRRLTPERRVADYTQAIMDLGATVCMRSKPQCVDCPLQSDCIAFAENRTSILPTPRPSKKIPVKRSIWLILSDQKQRVFLEKRPRSGIWGGMWSLPEFANPDNAFNWCREHSFDFTGYEILLEQRHTFSHFHLDYTAVVVHANNLTDVVMEADSTVWYNVGQENQFALPAPVSRLLKSFFLNHS